MIRFAHLSEAYLYAIYQTTIRREGEFRYPQAFNPLPELDIKSGMLHKCLLGLIDKGFLKFRQDTSGAHDGYEITAAGLEHIEDQLGEDDDLPLADSILYRALARTTTADTTQVDNAGQPRQPGDGENDYFFEARDAVAAVVAAVVAELANSNRGDGTRSDDDPPLSLTALHARTKLLVAPRASAALLDDLILMALERLNEMGVPVEKTDPPNRDSEAEASSLTENASASNAKTSGP